jgi:hypothetical protein
MRLGLLPATPAIKFCCAAGPCLERDELGAQHTRCACGHRRVPVAKGLVFVLDRAASFPLSVWDSLPAVQARLRCIRPPTPPCLVLCTYIKGCRLDGTNLVAQGTQHYSAVLSGWSGQGPVWRAMICRPTTRPVKYIHGEKGPDPSDVWQNYYFHGKLLLLYMLVGRR